MLKPGVICIGNRNTGDYCGKPVVLVEMLPVTGGATAKVVVKDESGFTSLMSVKSLSPTELHLDSSGDWTNLKEKINHLAGSIDC